MTSLTQQMEDSHAAMAAKIAAMAAGLQPQVTAPTQGREWEVPAHEEINLATVSHEELGLDPNNYDDPLVRKIYEAHDAEELKNSTPQTPEAIRFINKHFEPNDVICVVLIDPNKKGGTRNIFTRASHVDNEFIQSLHKENQTQNIYLGMNAYSPSLLGDEKIAEINRQGRTEDNVVAIRNLYADADKDGAAVLEKIKASTIVPGDISTVLESSPGKFNIIWRVEDISKNDAKPILKAVAQTFNTDTAVTDLARILRIPGFRNVKPEYDPKPIVKIASESDGKYSRSDFKLDVTEPEKPEQQERPAAGNWEQELQTQLAGPDIIQSSPGRNKTLTSILGRFRQVYELGPEQLYKIGLQINEARCKPEPLKESDVRTIANSVGGYEVKDNTPVPVILNGKTNEERQQEQANAQTSNGMFPPADMLRIIELAVVHPRASGIKHVTEFDYDKLIVSGHFVAVLAPMKGEKSIFMLEKAMCDACGADWIRHNNRGPLKVLFFDTENSKEDMDDRYEEYLEKFSPAQRKLIETNLERVSGKELTEQHQVDIEWNREDFWGPFAQKYQDRQIVYLDSWYDLHSINHADNNLQKKALQFIRKQFKNKTLIITQHVGRETNESLLKKNPVGLRELGARRFSNKIAQGSVLLRKVETIICLDKVETRDQEDTVVDTRIDFGIYSRSIPDYPVLSFQPVYGDDTREYKYRRELVRVLSSSAASVLSRLQGNGPWASEYDVLKFVGKGGKQKRAIDEVLFKGLLFKTEHGFEVRKADGAIKTAASNPVAIKQAEEFLQRTLPKNVGMLEKDIRQLAQVEGIVLGGPALYGLKSSLQDGQEIWTRGKDLTKDVIEDGVLKAVEDAITTNPKISLNELESRAKARHGGLKKVIEKLGYTRAGRGPWERTAA